MDARGRAGIAWILSAGFFALFQAEEDFHKRTAPARVLDDGCEGVFSGH
jgi:hypothetical protein